MVASMSFLLRMYRMGHGKLAAKQLLKEREKFNKFNSNNSNSKIECIVRLALNCVCTSKRVIMLHHLLYYCNWHRRRHWRLLCRCAIKQGNPMHDFNNISSMKWNRNKTDTETVCRASGGFCTLTMWSTSTKNTQLEMKSESAFKLTGGQQCQPKTIIIN